MITSLTISWTRIVRIQQFLADLLPRVQAVYRYFYFSTLPIVCTYFTLGNCQHLNIGKIIQNHEMSQEDAFWLKISICQSSMVHKGCWVNLPTRVGNSEASTGSGRPCSAHSSEGPCAQSGGRTKKASISSWDFAWNCHSLFKSAQDNSPRSPAQML